MKNFFSFLSAVILFFAVMPGLSAQVVYDAHTEAELISEVSSFKAGEPFWLGLRLKTDPHWHTYWINPGDSGLATTIKWTLPPGFKAGEIRWPFPQRIDIEQLTGYGYEDEVVLLTQITPPETVSQSSVEIKARADWLACEVPCIPGKGEFAVTLNVSDQAVIDPKWKEAFENSRQDLPTENPAWTFQAADQGQSYRLEMRTFSHEDISSIAFFPFNDSLILHNADQRFETIEEGVYRLTLQKNLRAGASDVKALEGVAVMRHADGAVSAVNVSLPFPPPQPSPQGGGGKDTVSPQGAERKDAVSPQGAEGKKMTSPQSLVFNSSPLAGEVRWGVAWMLAFAFLGGMILNLMPCVFPVLSIKVLSFVKHAQDRSALLKFAAGYSLGVICTFLILAGMLILLRAGGQSIGWGFQFQSSMFVAGMILLLYTMALNLFGLFEVRIGGIAGPKNSGGLNLSGAVFSGVLTVIVATPCTAPFMGTAMSFALTQPAAVNLLIFASLGLGLAFPFVLLCLFPSTLKVLPKPGAWMDHFKKLLAFPLLATVIWLLWVLEAQKGFGAVVWMLGSLLAVFLGLWMLSFVKSAVGRIAAWLLLASAVVLPLIQIRSLTYETAAAAESSGWLNYDPQLIDQLERDGRIIFYDFTARWCLTCQANERLVLAHPDVMKAFKDGNVALIKADWTNRDDTITQALSALGKNSVPVYVFSYPAAGGREQKILPELLTNTLVLDTLAGIPER